MHNISQNDVNSTSLVLFTFESTDIRVFNIEGEAWFAASEVAKALGYSNPQKAVRDHCKGVNETFTPSAGGSQTIKIIPERDVYRLIMRSKLPSAEQFEEKVVGEILPSIRKTGGYLTVTEDDTPETLMARALFVAKETLERQKEQIEQMQPKALAHDRIADANGTECLTDAAKSLQVSPKKFFEWLRNHGWIFKRIGDKEFKAYSDKIVAGYLVHKEREIGTDEFGDPKIRPQVRVTKKGLAKLAQIFSSPMAAE